MEDQLRTRVLVVANRTAATPRLMEAIGERRRRGPCDFALLIPDATDRKRADWTMDNALPLLRKAAGRPVLGIVGASGDPFASVQAAVSEGGFDEIIISTFSKKTSRWLRRDLVRRVEGLGLPVTAIQPRQVSVGGASEADVIRAGVLGGGG
jgi:hypothetical protein